MFSEVDLTETPAKGRLSLHSMPGRYEEMSQFVAAFAKEHVHYILCLVSDEEIEEKSPEYLKWLEQDNNTENVFRVPAKDFGIVEDFPAFEEAMDNLSEALRDGRNVLIHCAAGIGRTGTAGVCLLTDLGLGVEDSLERIQDASAGPEAYEQEQFLRAYVERRSS